MKTDHPLLVETLTANVDLSNSKNLFIDFSGNVCSNGEYPLGVLNSSTSQGEQASVIVFGVALVKAGAAVTTGSVVQSDASGRAIIKTTGANAGYALSDCAAANDFIRVLLRC